MTTILPDRLAEITFLRRGSAGAPWRREYCVMEAVAHVTGEPWTDHPACACPVITEFAIACNDNMHPTDRERLIHYIPRIAGSRSTPAVARRRAFLCTDYAVRVFVPIALRNADLPDHADAIAALPPITDTRTAKRAIVAIGAIEHAMDSPLIIRAASCYRFATQCIGKPAAGNAAGQAARYAVAWNEALTLLDALLTITDEGTPS